MGEAGYPVSIKGVLVRDGRVVLMHNERDEWELPGGRIEPASRQLGFAASGRAEERAADQKTVGRSRASMPPSTTNWAPWMKPASGPSR